MGQEQSKGPSKGELLYQQVSNGNAEEIKALHREGAGLEWLDREGKTPLIVACMNHELYNVAKTLIELGANVNAYSPGRHGGTPLHHAAKMGLDSSVWLLLLNGANPLVLNDDCQTALEIARAKKHTYVVRAIESHLCLFSGWLREFLGSGFLEVVAPQLVSRKVWVVVLPVRSWNLTRPYKLELAIYSTWQDAHPRTILALWKAYLEPKLRQSDPTVTIVDTTAKTHVKLGPANENDKQQLAWFSFACKGIPHANPVFLHNNVAMAMAIDASIQYAIREKPPFPDAHPSFTGVNNTSIFQAVLDSSFAAWKMLPKAIPSFLRNNVATVQPTAAPAAEDPELTMAINASMQHAIDERPPFLDAHPNFEAGSSSGGVNNTSQHGFLGTPNPNTSGSDSVHEAEQGGNSQHVQIHDNDNVSAGHTTSGLDLNPSAPPIGDEIPIDGPIHYPSIDLSPVEVSSPAVEKLPKGEQDAGGSGSSCVICLDAPAEGACIPCGHVAGCMSCLNEVKTKKWGCPVCRAKIDQVIKLYHV